MLVSTRVAEGLKVTRHQVAVRMWAVDSAFASGPGWLWLGWGARVGRTSVPLARHSSPWGHLLVDSKGSWLGRGSSVCSDMCPLHGRSPDHEWEELLQLPRPPPQCPAPGGPPPFCRYLCQAPHLNLPWPSSCSFLPLKAAALRLSSRAVQVTHLRCAAGWLSVHSDVCEPRRRPRRGSLLT